MPGSTTATGPTLDQKRASHAWQAIEGQVRGDKSAAAEFAREAKKLPVRIIAAGLGQALAFINAKARDRKRGLTQLHADISDWVLRGRGLPGKDRTSLLESIINGDSDFLRQATDETLAYLQWLNRFSEAAGLTDENE